MKDSIKNLVKHIINFKLFIALQYSTKLIIIHNKFLYGITLTISHNAATSVDANKCQSLHPSVDFKYCTCYLKTIHNQLDHEILNPEKGQACQMLACRLN